MTWWVILLLGVALALSNMQLRQRDRELTALKQSLVNAEFFVEKAAELSAKTGQPLETVARQLHQAVYPVRTTTKIKRARFHR